MREQAEARAQTGKSSEQKVTLSIVMVTFNSAHVLKNCLFPLSQMPRTEFVIVDNNSTDESVELVRRLLPEAVIIPNSQNEGFAKAVNKGARASSGKYLLLLNPDVVVAEQGLAELIAYLEEHTEIGVIAPLMVTPGDATIAAGCAPTAWRMFTHMSGLSRLAGGVHPILRGHYEFAARVPREKRNVEWVSGGALMTRRSLWDSMGGLSERWFMYGEDVEYCLRTRAASYEVAILGTVPATHSMGGSVKGQSGRLSTVWLENLSDLYATHIASGRRQILLWNLIVWAGFEARWCVLRLFSLVGDEPTKDSRKIQAHRFKTYARALRSESKVLQ